MPLSKPHSLLQRHTGSAGLLVLGSEAGYGTREGKRHGKAAGRGPLPFPDPIFLVYFSIND